MTYKYNPGFQSDDDSIRSFVVRHKDLRILREVLVENSTSSSNRHVLLVGPRGSGKSTLIRRLVAEIRGDDDLVKTWYPIVLGEESYTITSPGEFWLECVFHLAEDLRTPDLDARLRELKSETDESRLRELALGTLIAWASKLNRRFLLIVENLNAIIEDQMNAEEAWSIRHALQTVQQIMLLATATRRFEHIEDIEKALFEQFKVHELRSLTLPDVATLWTSLTDEKVRLPRARPIQILTGGSPRLIAILADFAISHSFANLMTRLTSLIDQYTDYFKSQLDSLASAERKIFVTVLEKWDPASTREIADEARVPVNSASANLARLRDRGAVVRRKSDGAQYWEAAERLFNLYYLMRRRGAPSTRVSALVRFMTVYYERDQLYERAAELARECCSLDPKLRQDHYTALTQILPNFEPHKREELLRYTPADFVSTYADFEAKAAKPIKQPAGEPVRSALIDNVLKLISNGDFAAAASAMESGDARTPKYSRLWAYLGYSFGRNGNFEKAEEYIRVGIVLDEASGMPWFYRGLVLREREDFEQAASAFETAILKGEKAAEVWVALGDCLSSMAKVAEAERSYKAAIDVDSRHADAWYSLGCLLAPIRERADEAEQAFREASRLDPENGWYDTSIGRFLLQERHDVEQAKAILAQAIDKNPKNARAWSLMLRAMRNSSGDLREAEEVYAKALKAIDNAEAWRIHIEFAQLLNFSHMHDRAEEILEAATRSNSNVGGVWFEYAQQIALMPDRERDAVDAYTKAVTLEPKSAQFWAEFGNFLSSQGKREREAEDAIRNAIRLDANASCGPWKNLGEHLERTGRSKEAVEAFNSAFALNPRCACAVEGYMKALVSNGARLEEVRRTLGEIIDRMPDLPFPHITLGKYLIALGQDRDSAQKEYLAALGKEAPPSSVIEAFLDTLDITDFIASRNAIDSFIAHARGEIDARNLMAWRLFKRNVRGAVIDYAAVLAQQAVNDHPNAWAFRHTLASLHCATGNDAAALEEIVYLANKVEGEALPEMIDLCIEIGSGRLSSKLREILSESPSSAYFEPLIVALGLDVDKEPPVAREVLEVARDIRKRIEERRSRGT